MAPILHCTRHAQGEHNVGGAYFIHDPSLTEVGYEQCRVLEETFPYQSSIDVIVSSPLRRTLDTALCSFKPAISRGVKIVALPELQEISSVASDTGSEVSMLEKEFSKQIGPSGPIIDLSLLDERWYVKEGKYTPSSEALIARAKAARQWLRARPEKVIVVVGHGGFLHYLTNDWSGIGDAEHACAWENCHFRSYHFTDDEDAAIVETEESRAARGGTGVVPSKEQEQLYLRTMQLWEDRGFQNPLKMNSNPIS
ncbi:hypothetical protein Egran_00770 [Elaphomyces granulatus]|uniref:Phosphoglycerate mutase-like protein n=1 Tax=Elaphomyces granulatus TaxID=519963 RepID=A0A232M512_9EURO|nr:hypothetical protein Egran_00770 [Elaphomyces granulatus]